MTMRPLDGYARIGKRFIPPMKQLPGLQEYSYVKDMLPELIWLGLINDRKGYKFGAVVLETVVELTKGWSKRDSRVNYAMQSAYKGLTTAQSTEIVEAFKKRGMLEDIQYALAPLVLLYDGFSMAFFGPPPTVISEEALVFRMKESVKKHLDRHQTPGIVLCGSLLLTRLAAGTIHFAQHINIPDLNAVIEAPDSEEAKRAAAFIRASAMAEVGMLDFPYTWNRYFWNRGAELAPCEPLQFGLSND